MISKVIVLCCHFSCIWAISKHPVLLVVSYDAFRYNFVNNSITPYLFSLRNEGTYADYLNNIFPTKTFPNHHSIATGLYAETHGVVGNHVYDPISKRFLSIKDYEMFHYNEEIEPIWVSVSSFIEICFCWSWKQLFFCRDWMKKPVTIDIQV